MGLHGLEQGYLYFTFYRASFTFAYTRTADVRVTLKMVSNVNSSGRLASVALREVCRINPILLYPDVSLSSSLMKNIAKL
jgi:hypothetical protein